MAEDHSFTPSNASLVDGYLRARIESRIGDHAMASLFHDADVCSARPYDLVRDHRPARVPCRDAGDGLQWFFFSPARFDGNSTSRRSRTVDGTNKKESWHSEGKPKPVEGSENGGYVQKFSYHVKTATGTIEKPGWIMAEHTFKNTRPGDVVLCKVYRSPRGPGRSNASSSSSTSSANSDSGVKRKAADHGEVATPSTRPRLVHVADEDVMFAEDIERGLMARSSGDHGDTAPLEFEDTTQNMEESPHPDQFGETMQNVEESLHPDAQFGLETTENVEESHPDQLAPASVDRVMTLQEMETLMMADEEDDGTTLRVPDGEDPEAFYFRVMDSIGDHQQKDADIQQQDEDVAIGDEQQQDADIQTTRGLLSEYQVITALATGVTIDELLPLDGPSMPCFHPGAVICS